MSQEKNKETWPNFFIVGAARAGTTSLYTYLKNTPGVYMSEHKEPHYFVDNMKTGAYDESKYLQLFKKIKNEKAIGEASTGYLIDPSSAKCIHDKIPDAKIIILLRDPVERAFSSYLTYATRTKKDLSSHEIFLETFGTKFGLKYDKNPYLGRGLYSSQVKKYLKIFGEENVGIWFFEDMKKDTMQVVKEVLKFLKIDSLPPDNVSKIYNPYLVYRGKIIEYLCFNKTIRKIAPIFLPSLALRHLVFNKLFIKEGQKPKLSENDRRKLENYYYDDVIALEKALKRKIPWEWVKYYNV